MANTGPVTTRPSRTREVVAIVLVVVGMIGAVLALLGGASSALSAAPSSTTAGFLVLFAVAGAAMLAGLVLGVVGLIRGPHRILSAVAVMLAVIPLLLSVTLLFGG